MKKYIFVLIITLVIFISAFTASRVLNQQKVQYIKKSQDDLAIDILAMETKFALLKSNVKCESLDKNDFFSADIAKIGKRLAYLESVLGTDNTDVIQLKKYYSSIQSKEIVLITDLSKECKNLPKVILYFYSNNDKDECSKCKNEEDVLESISPKYADKIRIYSFDFNLDSSVINTLKELYGVTNVPAIVYNNKTYNEFLDYGALDKIIGENVKGN